ncbi:MAG: methyltransferase [Methanopyraceae archaeon]
MEVTYRGPLERERLYLPREAFPSSARDAFRKREQVGRLLELLCTWIRPGDVIVDAGCGRGALTAALALSCPSCEVVGFDVREFRSWPVLEGYLESVGAGNLRFETWDLHEVVSGRVGLGVDRADVVVGLHLCGTLTDRMLELARELGARVVLVVPCCYGRASPRVIEDELGVRLERGKGWLKRELKRAEGSVRHQLVVCRIRGRFLEKEGFRVKVGVAFPKKVSGRRAFLAGLRLDSG